MRPLAIALTLLSVASSGLAATRTVGKPNTTCPNPQFSTITAAIAAAASGDEIAVCPALYAEQVVITKPVTLRGVSVNGISRAVIQPSPLKTLDNMPITAVITVLNTTGVAIEDLAIDASNNTVKGCDGGL